MLRSAIGFQSSNSLAHSVQRYKYVGILAFFLKFVAYLVIFTLTGWLSRKMRPYIPVRWQRVLYKRIYPPL